MSTDYIFLLLIHLILQSSQLACQLTSSSYLPENVVKSILSFQESDIYQSVYSAKQFLAMYPFHRSLRQNF